MNADAPVRETKVVAACPAEIAVTTAEMKRDRHTVAYSELFHVASYFDDRASELVAGHPRERKFEPKPGPMVLPQVPIAAADSARLGLNDRVNRARGWVREIAHFQGLRVLSNYCASHIVLLNVVSGCLQSVHDKSKIAGTGERSHIGGVALW
jgi:hypothetical protein